MINAVSKLEQAVKQIMPETGERIIVNEPPLGELARVHELMGRPEVKEDLCLTWQLTDVEIESMSSVFEEIARLHEIDSPQDIAGVLAMRKREMTNEIWLSVLNVVNQVKRRLNPMQPDSILPENGSENFGQDVDELIGTLDAKQIGDLPNRKVEIMMSGALRNTYAKEEINAINSVKTELVEKIQEELNLNKAWRVIRESSGVRGMNRSQVKLLRAALQLTIENQRPELSLTEIEELVGENLLAISAFSRGEVLTGKSKELIETLELELYKNPDNLDRTMQRCYTKIDSYLARSELQIDKHHIDMLKQVLALRLGVEIMRPMAADTVQLDEEIFHTVFYKTTEQGRNRIDTHVKNAIKASGLRDKLVQYINDPPNRREALSKWREFSKMLLSSRVKNVRLIPLIESLLTYVSKGGSIDQLKHELPITSSDLERLVDIASESGLDITGSKANSASSLIEWLQSL